jgi:hypothetical protein
VPERVLERGSFRSSDSLGLRIRARQTLDLSHSDRISDQDITVVGRTRGRVLVDARTELDQVLRNPVRTRVRRYRIVLRGSGSLSSVSQGTKGQEPGNRFHFGSANKVPKRRKAHESSGCGEPRFAAVRISAESKALELRGIVTSWSSEQEHAMSETAGGLRRREAHGSVEG